MARRESALRAVAEALNATVDADAALAAVLPHLSAMVGLNTAWVFRYDAARAQFREVAAAGLPPALARDGAMPLREGSCECQRLCRLGRLDRAVNIVTCSRLDRAHGDRGGLVRHASVALKTGGRRLGILNVAASGSHRFAPAALGLLEAVGDQVSVALDRADLSRLAARRLARMAAAADHGRALLAMRRPAQLMQAAADAAAMVLEAPFAALVLDDHVRARAERDFHAHPASRPAPERGGREALLWSVHGPAVRVGARSGVRQPVGAQGLVLVAESDRPGAFDAADAEALGELAAHLRLAMGALRARESARRHAAESERRRIAADLHDAVSQRLFAASLALARARALRTVGGGPAAGDEALGRAAADLAAARDEMRRLVHALGPGPDGDLGEELRRLLDRLAQDADASLSLRLPRHMPALSPARCDGLLHIAQEALHNALRHAQAERVEVRVRVGRAGVSLTVDDDGRGLPDPAPQGLGLRTMADRARRLGGSVRIGSGPLGGVRVRAAVPLTGPPEGE